MSSFLPLFHYNGGLLGVNLYKINKLLSLESIPVYGNALDFGLKFINKLHKIIDALETEVIYYMQALGEKKIMHIWNI